MSLQEKRLKKAPPNSTTPQPGHPQRYSATSGIAQAPLTKRTWTVGGVEDDGAGHRGGQKHAKGDRKRGGRSKGKDWGTGVNAIPVG